MKSYWNVENFGILIYLSKLCFKIFRLETFFLFIIQYCDIYKKVYKKVKIDIAQTLFLMKRKNKITLKKRIIYIFIHNKIKINFISNKIRVLKKLF